MSGLLSIDFPWVVALQVVRKTALKDAKINIQMLCHIHWDLKWWYHPASDSQGIGDKGQQFWGDGILAIYNHG